MIVTTCDRKMTRYARATGSKASNEKVANDATPWHIMKQQLVDNLSKEEHFIKKSAKELLEEKQDVFYCDVGNVNNDWAEFEENLTTKSNNSVTKKNKKKEKISLGDIKLKRKSSLKRNIKEVNNTTAEVKLKRCKKDKNRSNNVSSNQMECSMDKHSNENSADTLMKSSDTLQIHKKNENTSFNRHNLEKEKDALSKRQKRNMRKQKKSSCEKNAVFVKTDENTTKQWKKFKNKTSTDYEVTNNRKKVQNNQNNGANEEEEKNRVTKQYNNKFANKLHNLKNIPNTFHTKQFKNNGITKKKLPKIRDDKEHKRRKTDSGSTKIVINGIDIEIVKYDGFPVKKEDAERLCNLKQKMIMNGIPKKEIDTAMKLERRKAEKALTRIRKCVCFHCRKAGHNLSDCPELGSEQIGTGICFKCGSTEHTHFECKVARPTDFRYATCFICREQGHIAKQCPDNPKGIYPQGGCCKICGDVTHLKKDCPELNKEKEESTITLNLITNNNVESLGDNVKITHKKDDKMLKKVVKF
ncbi:uncharacterized protein LOC143144738 isoform X2 [Ptiloglossa arizonensis]|uniref:uncharacterized protein LOC143144738 isoform X2 n=1 Tax=Ptiloglossa arizonensis TaxID=3350558 RepID=UPI003F9ECDFF